MSACAILRAGPLRIDAQNTRFGDDCFLKDKARGYKRGRTVDLNWWLRSVNPARRRKQKEPTRILMA
jgi:hypothetical protein